MKVEFHNENNATITKGWRKKFSAKVYRHGPDYYWYFSELDNERVGYWIDRWLDKRAKKYGLLLSEEKKAAAWKPVANLPVARVVRP